MKVGWFHLMPYRSLPPDFEERYRSVWVDVPSHLFDPVKGHQDYNDSLDELEFADQMGFDGICVNEHHNNAYGLMPSPNLMAAMLCRRTSDASIIVLGNSLALYNPPIRVAEEFAMLDVVSGGRLVTGFPVGTSMDTNYCYGVSPASLREKYYEAHDLVVKAWTEPEPFAFNGKHTQIRYVNIWPRPLQKPHPPVWVPGGGSVETWDWVARLNYVYCHLSYYGHVRGTQVMDGFWNRMQELGVDDNPYRAGFLQLVVVSESDEKAEEEYSAHVDYFYKKCLHVYEGFADAPGYRTLKTMQRGLTGQHGGPAGGLRGRLTWKDYVDQGYVIAGSPATVIKNLRKAVENLRIGQLMVLLQIGSMPKELTMKNTELFAREVLPYIREMWSEYEDHWWPNPLRERVPSEVGAAGSRKP